MEAGRQVAGNGERSADGSGTDRDQEADLLADDRSLPSAVGPASIEQPSEDPQRERSLTIVYSALWQLRELEPDNESAEFKAARVLARRELDAIDEAAEASRHPAPPNPGAEERLAARPSGRPPTSPLRLLLARLRLAMGRSSRPQRQPR